MGLFSKHNLTFHCPLDGEAAPLSKIPDHAFSQGLLGAGLVIFPTKNKVYAPTDGKVDFIFPTKHAIGFETKEGFEYLIHVGIDTYKLGGEGFQLHVEAGDHVTQGQLLLEFDPERILYQGLSTATPIVFPNAHKDCIDVLKYGTVNANDELLTLKRK